MNKKILLKIPIRKKEDNRNKFLFRVEEEKLLIQGTHVIYVLGNIEKGIYCAIDGKKNIKEIISELALQYNFSDDQILNDVTGFVIQLLEKNLIELKDL